MPTIPATWIVTSGDWFTPSNWSEPNPDPLQQPLHYVPGANEDVSIPDVSNMGTPFTVTYNGTSSVNTLAGSFYGTLDITGGSLTLNNGGAANSMSVNVGAGAELVVGANTLVTTGGSYSGTVSGAGTLAFVLGTFDINAGAVISTAEWILGVSGNGTPSTTNLNTDLTYSNHFVLTDTGGNLPILNLNGHNLTLAGTSVLDGRMIGPGTVRVSGDAVMPSAAFGGNAVLGGAVLRVLSGGTITQSHNTSLGDAVSTGTVAINYGGEYQIDTSSSIGGDGTHAIINNSGRFIVNGAGSVVATVSAQLNSTRTISVGSQDSLVLWYGDNTIGGIVSGAGKLVFGFGSDTTLSTDTLTIATLALNGGNGGAALHLGKDISYAGALVFENAFDALHLDGYTLTLTGSGSKLLGNIVHGAGTIRVEGSAEVGGNLQFGGSNGVGPVATLENAGNLTQTGHWALHGNLHNEVGGTYTIGTAGTLSPIGSGGTFTNDGALVVNAQGGSTIATAFVNTGSISITSGALLTLTSNQTLGGTISGAGTLRIGTGVATIDGANITVASFTISSGVFGAEVTLASDLSYAGNFTLAGFFDHLLLNGHMLTLTGTTSMHGFVEGLGGALDTLVVNGASIDLSDLHFADWEATDKVTMNGTATANQLIGSVRNDSISGAWGNDTLIGGAGNDTLNGGNGIDTADYSQAGAPVIVNLGLGTAQDGGGGTDTLSTIENIVGSAFGDDLTGSTEANMLEGGNGDDTLRGGGGDDTAQGGDGVDYLYGGGGNDTLNGGNDNDRIYGQQGDDRMYGGAGGDRLYGGAGNDTMTGNGGNDTFYFDTALNAGTNVDVITDFSNVAGNNDGIRLNDAIFSAFAAGHTLTNAEFISGAGVTAAATASQHIIYDTTTGWLYYDQDGNGSTHSAVHFATVNQSGGGHPVLTAADFVVY